MLIRIYPSQFVYLQIVHYSTYIYEYMFLCRFQKFYVSVLFNPEAVLDQKGVITS
jgi:hypothetical protein